MQLDNMCILLFSFNIYYLLVGVIACLNCLIIRKFGNDIIILYYVVLSDTKLEMNLYFRPHMLFFLDFKSNRVKPNSIATNLYLTIL